MKSLKLRTPAEVAKAREAGHLIAEVLAMLKDLRGARLLQGFRGSPPADLEALSRIIASIGDAAFAMGPDLAALEVNPLRLHGCEIECLDGLAVYSA